MARANSEGLAELEARLERQKARIRWLKIELRATEEEAAVTEMEIDGYQRYLVTASHSDKTSVDDDSVTVEHATKEDIEIAVRRALESAGASAQELRAQARLGRFSSEDARLAWFVISPFIDLPEE